MLNLPSKKRKREIYYVISIVLLLAAVLVTFLICQWLDEPFYNSWVSSMGEAAVAGMLFGLQGIFIK